MANNILGAEASDNSKDKEIALFLKDMSELLLKNHFGLTGKIIVYRLEHDDYNRKCIMNNESELEFI